MTVTLVGVAFGLAGVVAFIRGSRSLMILLGLSTPFAVTAAATAGGNGLSPFHLVCVFVVAKLVTTRASGLRAPAFLRALGMFFVVAGLSIVMAWTFFEGIPVLIPRAGIDTQVLAPGVLAIGVSNAAQMLYLTLVVLAVWYFYREGVADAALLAPGLLVGSCLSSARYFLPESWPVGWFDNWPGVDYDARVYSIGDRFRGNFAEPSYLAVFSLVAAAYFLIRLVGAQGSGWVNLLGVASAVMNLVLSLSGTGVLGSVILAVLMIVVGVRYLVVRRQEVRVLFLAIAAVAAIAFTSGQWSSLATRVIADKAKSESRQNRFESDRFSLGLLDRTDGLGVGLGSNRPSSFVTFLLSNVGLLGTALLVVVLVGALRTMWAQPGLRPGAWALAAVLIAKAISEPSLSQPLMWVPIMLAAAQARLDVARRHEPERRGAVEAPLSTREDHGAPAARPIHADPLALRAVDLRTVDG